MSKHTPECCEVDDCSICREIAHDNFEIEDCAYCREEAAKREAEAEAYCDAQVAYYAKGGFFDTIFDGAFDE